MVDELLVMGWDPAWAGDSGWALLSFPADELLLTGVVPALRYKGKVTETVQRDRAGHLFAHFSRLLEGALRRGLPLVVVQESSAWVAPASAKGQGGKRRPFSASSVRSVSYVRAVAWVACSRFDVACYAVTSGEARRRVLSSLHTPRLVWKEALRLAERDEVKAQVIAGVGMRYGGADPVGWLAGRGLTDHEADAVVVAAAMGGELYREAAG